MTRVAIFALALCFAARAALAAETTKPASPTALTAENLFQEGRALLEAGKATEACPKLAESQRLDPATGTLMALAMCHEQTGKLASAWLEFTEVERRSRRSGRTDRAELAQEHGAALRSRLSTLTIEVPPEVAKTPELEVSRDGTTFERELWNVPVPVDGGSYKIEAKAPGRAPFQTSVSVKPELDSERVCVPVPTTSVTTPVSKPLQAKSADVESEATLGRAPRASALRKAWGGLEWSGIVAGSVGVGAMAVGGVFLASAFRKANDSKSDCASDVCGPQGLADRRDAVHRGNLASVFGGGGAALALIGATLFWVGRSQHDAENPGTQLSVSLDAGPHGFSAGVARAF